MLLCVQKSIVFAICLEFYGLGKTDGNSFCWSNANDSNITGCLVGSLSVIAKPLDVKCKLKLSFSTEETQTRLSMS